MKVTRLDDDGAKMVLQIEAPWSEIMADYHDLLAQYAKIKLPGFRPGKVPQAVIEKRFHKELIEDLSARSVQRFGREAVRETGIESLGPLEAFEIECDNDRPFRARVRYLPMPEFRVPELAALATVEDGTDALDGISRRLLKLAPFAVPGELVRQELDLDGLGECSPDSEAWRAAADRIRLMVILNQIARQEGIDVDETDVNRRIAEKAQEFGTTTGALKLELEKGGGLTRLQDMILAERTLEYLLETSRQASKKEIDKEDNNESRIGCK
jgi:FKBP-type peptidyl-prolyl cis-trans isomerase (trigger factor)